MNILYILPLLATTFSGICLLSAGVTVNSPLPITHNVVIQPIITKHSDGTTAMFLGSSSRESYIKGQVDRVWAQSGVSITWLAPYEYENDYAYDGSPSNYSSKSRPTNQLSTILSQAGTPPKSPDETVINMFFVEIVPGFNQLNDNYANGLAYVDSNGICMHIGRNLINWTGGRDVIASVMAHEIGHNLGLSHYGGSANLMSSGDPDSYLISSQTTTVFQDSSWAIDGFDFLQQAESDTNYSIWAEYHDLSGDPEDDDDGDKLSNIIEFALGLDPNTSSALPTPVWSAAGLTWNITKNSDADEDGLEVLVEVSDDCGQWIPAGTNSSSVVLADSDTELSVRLNAGLQGYYMRLNVNIPQDLEANAFSFVPLQINAAEPAAPTISGCANSGCGCKHLPTP